MTYAPPSSYSVYDIALALSSIIPSALAVPSFTISQILYSMTSNIYTWLLKPISDTVGGVTEFMFNMLGNMFNSFFQSTVNFIYMFVINPLKTLVQSALNRFYEKLEGVIFISIVVPSMISETKSLMHKPSLSTALLLLLKPVIAGLGARLIANTVKPMLRPVTIEPSIPPTVVVIPPPSEVSIKHYDTASVYDMLTSVIEPPMGFTETYNIGDVLTVEAVPPLTFLEFIITNDVLSVEIIPPFSLSDTATIYDLLTVEIIPPLSMSDSIAVDDVLIIGAV